MHMLMVVFRSSLKERVHELLQRCDVRAFTEVNETVGYGQTGPAKGWRFIPAPIPSFWSRWIRIMPDASGEPSRSGTTRRPNIAGGKSRP